MKMGDFIQLAAWCRLLTGDFVFYSGGQAKSFPPFDGAPVANRCHDEFQTSTLQSVAHRTRLLHTLNLANDFLSLLFPTLAGQGSRFPALCFDEPEPKRCSSCGRQPVLGLSKEDRAAIVESLAILKSEQPIPERLRDSALLGFPSLRIVLGVLSAVALWRIRWVCCLGVDLGAPVFNSTLTPVAL